MPRVTVPYARRWTFAVTPTALITITCPAITVCTTTHQTASGDD